MAYIADFPTDGRVWMIFRVDDLRPSGANAFCPSIAVTLRPLSERVNRDALDEMSLVLCHPGGPDDVTVRVPIGLAPNLRMGDLWRNGDFFGRGPWTEFEWAHDDGVEPRARIADVRASYDSVGVVGLEALVENIKSVGGSNPALWKPLYAARLAADDHAMEIPAYEIFRSFFAPHSDLANALASGPWSQTRGALVDEAALAEAREQGLTEIVPLRPTAARRLAPFLHPLIHDDAWAAAAEGVYADRVRALACTPNANYTPMTIRWPFDARTRRLRVRGFPHPLRPKLFVALEVVEFEWQGPERLVVPVPPPRMGPRASGGSCTQLVEGSGAPSVFREKIQVSVTAPVEEGSVPIAVPTAMPMIGGAPVIERATGSGERAPLASPHGVLAPRRVPRSRIAASAAPSWAVRSEGEPGRRRCPRFQEVMRTMERARSVGGIVRWSPVAPAEGAQDRDGVPVWSCPPRLGGPAGRTRRADWSWIVSDIDGAPVRRGALVLRIESWQGPILSSITLEPGRGEENRYCSLIFPEPIGDLCATVRALLRFATERAGVWTEDPVFAAEIGVSALVKWKHFSHAALPDDRGLEDLTLSRAQLMRRLDRAARAAQTRARAA